MKKFLAAVVLTVAMLTFVQPSYANNDAAYFLGGMLGGFILNEAVRPGPRYYYEPAPARVYDEPVYERVCQRRWVRVWDRARHEYVKVRRKQCEFVRVY